jgi:alpha-L-fucosidase 2
LQEWHKDWDNPDDTHRHISHLYSLHPGNQITPLHTPELAKAAKQTLIHRGDYSTGWSMAWKLNWWARLKDGNKAYELFKSGLTYVGRKKEDSGRDGTGTNLFTNAHGAVQIDGNFGGAAGIAELLVQSHEGYIQLLPALPDELGNGEVKGLVTRGGFVIDLKWDNGSLQSLVIHSRLGGNCRIKVNGNLTGRDVRLQLAEGANPNPLLAEPDLVPFVNNAPDPLVEINPDPGNIYDFPTEAGKSYRFRMAR